MKLILIKCNYEYSINAKKHIILHYKKQLSNLIKVYAFSDGCTEQYKSRFSAYEMTFLPKLCGVNILHTFAPTACFKNCTDTTGARSKREMKHDERAGTVRANDAFAVYEHMNDNYSFDLMHSKECKSVSSFQIKRDYHRFIVNQNQYVPDLMDKHGDKIITVTAPNCDKNNKAIPNIRQTYQWRFDMSFEPGCMEFRQTTCFCQSCLHEDYEVASD